MAKNIGFDLRKRLANLLSRDHGDLALAYLRLERAAEQVLAAHRNDNSNTSMPGLRDVVELQHSKGQ